MSSKALLSVVIWQRERRTAERRFAQTLSELLTALGVSPAIIAAELALAESIVYARATNRSVLASMRDQAYGVRYQLSETSSPLELSLYLAVTPCGPLGHESPRVVAPRMLNDRWGVEPEA